MPVEGSEKTTNYLLEHGPKLAGFLSASIVSVALSFDLGYFYGIEISIFTFFSLSEHVLFTLEALPKAFSLVAFACILLYLFGDKINFNRMGVHNFLGIEAGRKAVLLNAAIFYSLFLLIGLILAYLEAPRFFSHALVLVIYIGITIPVLYKITSMRKSPKYYASMATVLYLYILFFSFLEGNKMAIKYTEDDNCVPNSIIRLGSEEFNGRVMRSGANGILFFDNETKDIVFIKWDKVQQIQLRRSSEIRSLRCYLKWVH